MSKFPGSPWSAGAATDLPPCPPELGRSSGERRSPEIPMTSSLGLRCKCRESRVAVREQPCMSGDITTTVDRPRDLISLQDPVITQLEDSLPHDQLISKVKIHDPLDPPQDKASQVINDHSFIKPRDKHAGVNSPLTSTVLPLVNATQGDAFPKAAISLDVPRDEDSLINFGRLVDENKRPRDLVFSTSKPDPKDKILSTIPEATPVSNLGSLCSEKTLSSPVKTMNPLPNHLKFLPPSIPIPERYTWVVLHRRWTLIPKVLSNKFTPNDQTLTDPPLDDPMDEELVDWGDDEDDQKFVEEKNFMDKDNVIEAQEAHFQDDPFLEDEVPTEFGK